MPDRLFHALSVGCELRRAARRKLVLDELERREFIEILA